MNDSKREQFIAQNAHLWGKVDPIDGIPYRQPVPIKENNRKPDEKHVNIYHEPHRSGIVVRVRWRGVLHYVGVFETERECQKARDAFRREKEATRHKCACGEVWHDGEEKPTDCCLFSLFEADQNRQEILAEA